MGATMCCAFRAVTQHTMVIDKQHHAGAMAVCINQAKWPPFKLSTRWGCKLRYTLVTMLTLMKTIM